LPAAMQSIFAPSFCQSNVETIFLAATSAGAGQSHLPHLQKPEILGDLAPFFPAQLGRLRYHKCQSV